jgi:putative transposase
VETAATIIQPEQAQESGAVMSLPDERELDAIIYANAPEYNRKLYDKYLPIIEFCNGYKGAQLRRRIDEWNMITAKESDRTSYRRVMRVRQVYAANGASGLIGKYGNRRQATQVPDALYNRYKEYYLVEGAPSSRSCWLRVVGFAQRTDPAFTTDSMPSPQAFQRRLDNDIPESSQYLARYGYKLWNRKYNAYIDRNYDGIRAGECYVSDHAQIDVATMLPNGKVCFPWVTAWRDFLSGKWLGWMLHPEAPCSDHIFQAFHTACLQWGLCSEVLIDNGKDYRSKDFAGSRRHVVGVDENKTTAMLSLLGITPRFALPYNAQTKPIERDFLRIKELLSKHMIGYRGGNVVERPEKLQKEINAGDILSYSDFEKIFDDFIVTCLNKNTSHGKNLLGKCPDQVFAEQYTQKKTVTREALKLFCMRSTGVVTIGRNGIRDSKFSVTYWGEWMSGMRGRKVYVRRDLKNYAECWVFDAVTDEYIGNGRMGQFCAPALAHTEVEKRELSFALERKRRQTKIARAYARTETDIDPFDELHDLKAGIAATSSPADTPNPVCHEIPNSKMDRVIERRKQIENIGTHDKSHLLPEDRHDRKIFSSDIDKEAYEERLRYA